MSKPELLKRLRNKSDQVTADNLIAFSSTNGIDVHDSGITKDSIKAIVSNNPSVLAHLNNSKIHVTLKEKDAIMTTNESAANHIADQEIHVSITDRLTWNTKETPEGAQSKVNVAFSAVNKHMQNTELHVATSDRNKWNNKYTKEEIDNKFAQLEYNNIWKESVDSFDDLFTKYPSPQRGWTVTSNEDNVTYRFDGTEWIPISSNAIPLATIAVDGKMSKEDKQKLESIEKGANKYTHPDNPNIRHVTDKEKVYWNSKAEDRTATYQYNGLLSKEDKYKLDGLEEGATNFVMPKTLDPQIINQDENNRFVTDREKTEWSNKANSNIASANLNGLMSNYDKIKLNTIEANANYYVHPDKHEPTIIQEDSQHRFVTESQITTWNNKLPSNLATHETAGAMSAADKAKLDSIEAGSNNYHLPAELPPTIIRQDPNNRFFTDQERETLTLKKDMSSILVGTGIFNGTDGTIINHEFGNTSFSVSVTPTANPNGGIGEIWVKKTNTFVVVYCAGSAKNIPFDFTLIYYN